MLSRLAKGRFETALCHSSVLSESASRNRQERQIEVSAEICYTNVHFVYLLFYAIFLRKEREQPMRHAARIRSGANVPPSSEDM